MIDVVDRATRSRMMSGIRGKNTKPELVVRSFLHRRGLRFRLQTKLPGKPDLVFPRFRVALFVHGCFWHRHAGCRYATTPASNAQFWREKFKANILRDEKVKKELRAAGWRVKVIWACELKGSRLRRLAREIASAKGRVR